MVSIRAFYFDDSSSNSAYVDVSLECFLKEQKWTKRCPLKITFKRCVKCVHTLRVFNHEASPIISPYKTPTHKWMLHLIIIFIPNYSLFCNEPRVKFVSLFVFWSLLVQFFLLPSVPLIRKWLKVRLGARERDNVQMAMWEREWLCANLCASERVQPWPVSPD